MGKEQNIVIIAAYQALEPAQKNFDALVQLAKGKQIKTDGMILVQKDKEGKVIVNETGDHLGAKAWAGEAVSVSSSVWRPRRCWPRWPWALRRARWLASSPSTNWRAGSKVASVESSSRAWLPSSLSFVKRIVWRPNRPWPTHRPSQ